MAKALDPDDAPKWLATLWPFASSDPFVIAGVNNDDCAVLRWDEPIVVVTTDFLNASPIAVQLGIATAKDLGRLVVASSVSDLCGSGARPRAMLLGAMLEHGSSESEFQIMMTGAKEAATNWGVKVIGGDTKLGLARTLFSVGIGSASSRANLFLNDGGEPDDLLWSSGSLGSCSAATIGLAKLDISRECEDWAKNVILNPKIPLEQSRQLSMRQLGKAGVDISDGLGADLHKLCRASGTGAIIDASRIPVDEHLADMAGKLGVEPWMFAFGSGGDCQFLVSTAPAARREASDFGFHLIGRLTKSTKIRLAIGNRSVALPMVGHRDAHGLSFVDEILANLKQLPRTE